MSNAPAHAAGPGLATVISGPYKSLWDDMDMGTNLDGFTLRQSNSGIDITSDLAGDTILDTIYAGTILTVTVTLQNWNAQAIEPMIWWHGNSNPVSYEWGLSDGVGQRHWDNAKPLILHACHAVGFDSVDTAGDTVITPSTGANPANPNIDPLDIVFPKTLLKKDTDLDIIFSFRPRYITLTFDVYPISTLYEGTAWNPVNVDQVERLTDCSSIRYFSATRGTPPAP